MPSGDHTPFRATVHQPHDQPAGNNDRANSRLSLPAAGLRQVVAIYTAVCGAVSSVAVRGGGGRAEQSWKDRPPSTKANGSPDVLIGVLVATPLTIRSTGQLVENRAFLAAKTA